MSDGPSPTPPPGASEPSSEIREALYRGDKIQAIKLFRARAGCGLAEAKNAMDKLEAELRAQHPDKFSAASSRRGCLGVMVAAGLMLVWFAWKRVG